MFLAIRKRMEEREEGFTLIELLVVVIIIGILAAIAIPAFLEQRERAWRSAVQSDLRNAGVAAETHYTDNGVYTGFTPADTADTDMTANSVIAAQEFCIEGASTNDSSIVWTYDSTPPAGEANLQSKADNAC